MSISNALNLDWVSLFLDDVLGHWLNAADNADGLFHPYLNRQWQRHADGPRTLVSQCRLIYNFARAYERSGDEKWRDAAGRGIIALNRFFRDETEPAPAWRWSCESDGARRDEAFNAYGHAFVILALSTAARALQNDAYAAQAQATWRAMKTRFGDEHGGLIWYVSRGGLATGDLRSQNPVMHTFEALLALRENDAMQLWHFLNARRLPSGALPEWYDAAWQPLQNHERAGVDIGHQFEWAFLLSEAHALNLGEGLLETGRELLRLAVLWGFDKAEGGVWNEATLDGALKNQNKGWWQQTEAIRALCRYACVHGDDEFIEPLRACLDFARRHFVDEEFGGWYANPPGLGGTVNLDKGNPYKLDYHVVNMCLELEAATRN